MSGRKDEGALEELSVDAMNRLRASLGLAPLCAPAGATGPDAETVVPAAETPDTVAQRAAAAERAADARSARALRARTQGLGAAILAEEGGVDEDAAHWLARTQARHAAATAAPASATTPAAPTTPTTLGKKRARRTGEEEESAGAVRLAAHAERLAAGLAPQEDVVLTLRDTGVLDAAGDDVNGAADVLESAAAAEDERRARAQAEARRTPASAKYDDDEFAELRADAAVAAADAAADASAGTGTGVAAEFYTSEEMAQLFRRKRRRTAAAGSGGGRRTTAESVAGAALEALLGDGGDSSSSSAAAAGGGGDKKEEEEEGGGGGAPKRTREEEERATLGALERLTREQRTQERAIARERREALVRAHTDAGADDDDDAALYRALARTRAAAQQRAQQPRVEERVVQSLAARQQQPMDTDEARPSGDKVVVDDVSSFLTKIEATTLAAAAEAQEQQRQRAEAEAEAEAEAGRAAVKQEPVDTAESGHKEEDKDEDKEDEEEPFAEQPLYSVSAALAQLSRRGGVDKVTQNSTVLVGRKQDGVFDLRDDPAPHLKLEYLDADGQQLRPKEAHRLMSYIFHGRKPHQKKLEKLARQKEEARRVAEMESTDTPLHAVAAMERLQQETKQPYLVLSGKGAQTALLNLKKE